MSSWKPNTIIQRQLDDGFWYYGRLIEFPWAAFYRFRSKSSENAIDEVVQSEVLFIIAAHKSLLEYWKPVAKAEPDKRVHIPDAQAVWDSPDECQIIDAKGEMRPATPEECRGLEPAAVWEPEHIADRLQDAFAGRPNQWLEDLVSGF
jgi:hypothetical protein